MLVPRETGNNGYAKFGGTNKEYYGIFRSGLLICICPLSNRSGSLGLNTRPLMSFVESNVEVVLKLLSHPSNRNEEEFAGIKKLPQLRSNHCCSFSMTFSDWISPQMLANFATSAQCLDPGKKKNKIKFIGVGKWF